MASLRFILFRSYYRLLQNNLDLSGGGSTFATLKFNKDMNNTNLTLIDASYVAPTVYVIEMASEGCLCGSLNNTQSNDPDDYEYGGKL